DAQRVRRLTAEVEQVLRDVRKDDVLRAALERAEADQSLAAADVEQAVPSCEACTVEHLVPDAGELLEHLAPHLRIAAVAVLRQPRGPNVAPACHPASPCRLRTAVEAASSLATPTKRPWRFRRHGR